MEATVDQKKAVPIYEFQFQMRLVAVHVAVKRKLIRNSALEGKVGIPVFVGNAGECECFVLPIDRGVIVSERVVDALEGRLKVAFPFRCV